jgi:hypothetical protein
MDLPLIILRAGGKVFAIFALMKTLSKNDCHIALTTREWRNVFLFSIAERAWRDHTTQARRR